VTTIELNLRHFTVEVDDDGVAVVTIDRAGESVNSLAPELTEDLLAIIERCETDDQIIGLVVVSGKQDSFIVGADVRWLETLESPEQAKAEMAIAHDVFARLEALTTERGKPVVAAIHGACLGGGLEIAMACSERVSSDDSAVTQFGQPEIRLGLIPGVGGTQRLPRLVGITTSLDLILTGRSLRPRKARAVGLVDEVCPKEVLVDVARRRVRDSARDGAAQPGRTQRVKSWLAPSHLQQLALEENPVGRKMLFAKAEERMVQETGGHYPAAPAALAAVRVGVEEGPEAGYAEEIQQFAPLVTSPESIALRSIFTATQQMKHETGVTSDVTPGPVRRVGVIGGGLMGAGIATVNTLNTGAATRIKEIDHAAAGRALAHVAREVSARRKRRRITRGEATAAMHQVTATVDYSGFEHLDLVIEAVFEDLGLKQQILQDVEAATKEDAIFASNTSSIPIADIAAHAKRPEQVIGMHYFSPVEKMPLLEVVVTQATADWVTATCVAFGRAQGKTVIVVNDSPGFYTTRVLIPYMAEFVRLVQEGAKIEDIDDAATAFGFPVGPAVLTDEVGIDVGAKIGPIVAPTLGDRVGDSAPLQRLVAAGYLGRKSGLGYYRYDKGKRGGVDDAVYELLRATDAPAPSQAEIQDRLVYPFLNEAARCLEEGVLMSARDGDVGAIMGLGWSPYTGGPFTWIDTLGVSAVVDRMDQLAAAHGDRFEPAPILRAHAESGAPLRP
jgi:3-hydroxyacyl-CoA dehydrogenase/enoyl-CoA hydratase/3-hydroxybutyryl-CoA epimerase